MHKPKRRKGDEEPMEVDESIGANGDVERENGNNNGIDGETEIDHISDDDEGGVRIGDIYIPPAPKPALTFDSNGPRMVISHIVNENFKSYAGKEVLGPFHKSFTAIIGPNGSGKSNVIDSMLFVFGYRASKIRSKKISVLIHSSSKFPNVTSASVTVQFCEIIDGEGDNFTVVPGSEIEVTRTAFKDNSSYYSLNGRRVQFKEVAKLLRGQGIDLDHNRFLILQGEVEQIAMMKPKGQNENDTGMLEYLEDIIGTARYKEPIEKLFVRVEEYSVLRKEKLNRVRFVEQEKLKLEQPMKEAIEMMNLTNSFIRTRNLLLQKYLFETEKILATKQANLEKEKQKVAEIEEKLKKIQDELYEKNAVLKKGSQKYVKLQNKKEELTEKLQSLKKKSVTVQADITQGNKKKKNLEQLLEQEKGKLIDLETIPEKNKREIEDCEKLLEKNNELKEKAEEELQKVVAGVRSKTQGLQEQKDKFQAKMIELNKIVDEANKNFKLAESEMKIYVSTEKKEMEKLENMKVDYEKAVAELEEKRTVYDELSETYPENERKVYEMNKKLHQIKTEETSVANTARNLRSQLEESRQAMSANKSRGRVLDSLMKEKQNGNIPGIFGRLGDLGGIDPKYDVAISTCCGALDNIVVDCVETAQACLEFLRANDIGRATFIALDKQQHFTSQMNRQQDFPENVPRLFDLIRVKDSRVLAAFYYGVRDTLVATDLDQASRIAYGRTRYRVVSLKGDVIEIAGTMSGGGRTMMRGRMSSSVQQDTSEHDPRAIRDWEEKLEREETRLNELRREQSAIEDSLQTLEKTTQEQKMMLNKVKIQLKSLEEQIPILQNQIKAQERKAASSKVDERQRKVLEKKMNDANAILEEAKHNAGEVEKEVHGVDAQIAAVAGNKVKSMQNNVNELSAKISKITTEITKLRVAINTSIRNAKKSKDKIAQMEIDQSETLKNLENWNIQKKKLTLDSGEIQKEIEECDEKINEGGEEFSDLKKEIKKLQDEETKCKSERLEANNSLTLMEKSVTECAAKLPQWERELKQLKLEDPGIEGMENLSRPEPLQKHTAEELEGMTVEEIRNKLNGQKARIGDNKPNLQAILDYKTKEEVFLKRAAELEEITAQRNEMRALHDQLKKRRLTDFLSGFNTITSKLKEMYQMITLGGDAELEMVDSLDPFSEGITFIVRPPSKSWKYISNLSGGEKTLSSLALVFALHYYRPTPLYVMDEIDAALDFKNVSIVANYIKDRTKNAQFIIISLRYNMFEVCNRLVGIYKTEDCTKSVTVNNALPIDFVIDGDIMD